MDNCADMAGFGVRSRKEFVKAFVNRVRAPARRLWANKYVIMVCPGRARGRCVRGITCRGEIRLFIYVSI